MENDQYISVAGRGEGIYKDRGSKFIAVAMPASTEEEARSCLDEVRSVYHDAHTKAYAWRIGRDGETWKVNDDGEPSGSAGRQILGQMMSRNLSDVIVVVVRYFGGTKLGIPGLIKAFKTSSADALDSAGTVVKTVTRRFRISFGYMEMNDVMKVLKDLSLRPEKQDFGEACSLEASVREASVGELERRLGFVEDAVVEEIL